MTEIHRFSVGARKWLRRVRSLCEQRHDDGHNERHPEAEKIGLADIERRGAAISARLLTVAKMIVDVPAITVAGALAKLQNFWHYEYENHPEGDTGTSEEHVLKGAIEALGGEAVYVRWTEEEVRARYGYLED